MKVTEGVLKKCPSNYISYNWDCYYTEKKHIFKAYNERSKHLLDRNSKAATMGTKLKLFYEETFKPSSNVRNQHSITQWATKAWSQIWES